MSKLWRAATKHGSKVNLKPNGQHSVDDSQSGSPQVSMEHDSNEAVQPVYDTPTELLPSKVPVTVEVCLKPTSSAVHKSIKLAVERLLEKRPVSYMDGPVELSPGEDSLLEANVESIRVVDTDESIQQRGPLLFWQLKLMVHVYQLNEEGAAEEVEGEEDIATYKEFQLPSREFHGLWESLIFDTGVKHRLLRYAASALLFAERQVNDQLVAWNRVILLHGPPGTGKTSLCKGIAHKLAIRFSDRFTSAQLVEVNAHSLFSKWFSESGKLVTKLFQKIGELVEEQDSLVFVLIDEVESLTAARKAALSGAEPSDAIRVVNALLTQVDALKSRPNVMILTTSNITDAIDLAFVDRADIKAYIGPPTTAARYSIFHSAIKELHRCDIIAGPEGRTAMPPPHTDLLSMMQPQPQHSKSFEDGVTVQELALGKLLLDASNLSEGFSGRALRKLPFLAHAALVEADSCTCEEFLAALQLAVRREIADRSVMGHDTSRS
eukprot:jgi/Chlat1/1817/Chrsp135S08687